MKNLTELSTKELLEQAAVVTAESLADFRTSGPGKEGTEARKQQIARGDLVEVLLNEARSRDDYEAANANREFERRAVTKLPVTSATKTETRTEEKPVAVSQVTERESAAQQWAREQRDLHEAFAANSGALREHRGVTNLSAVHKELDSEFRDVVRGRSREAIDIPVSKRSYYQPGVEKRDLLKSGGTGTQSFGVDVFDRIVEHMVEGSAVLKAGATVINTDTGEQLVIPKTTGLATSAIFNEGASITESDPPLDQTVLGAYKYATYFEVSRELAEDGHTDLLEVLARLTGESLGQAFGNHLINGTGSGQPRGILLDATLGKTAPAGVLLNFGTQSTAGQGTDLLYDLVGSLAEPYARSADLSWLMRNATLTNLSKLKDSAGQPVSNNLRGNMYVDPFVPAQAASAKSVIVGDMSRYVVRFVGGIRFERSDHYKFQNDLVAFKATVRLDAATVDNNAFKYLAHPAS